MSAFFAYISAIFSAIAKAIPLKMSFIETKKILSYLINP